MTNHPDPLDDLQRKLKAAQSDGCQWYYAQEIVLYKERRGDYKAVIHGELDASMREALVMALVRECSLPPQPGEDGKEQT